MNRIESVFTKLRDRGRKGLVAYLTAGDPDMERSEADIRAAAVNGVDVLEIGVPFSDATADGPTIQAAAQRALAAGMTLSGGLDLVSKLRKDCEIPIVLFGYANPFFRYGFERLCKDAAESGVDGLLVVDMPYEHWDELAPFAGRNGLCLIPLIAPTTPEPRARLILKSARGFVYYIMVRGVTGARSLLAADLGERTGMLRACTQLPIAAGFGVSNGVQAMEAARWADAVVVGSALVEAAQAGRLVDVVKDIRSGLDMAEGQ